MHSTRFRDHRQPCFIAISVTPGVLALHHVPLATPLAITGSAIIRIPFLRKGYQNSPPLHLSPCDLLFLMHIMSQCSDDVLKYLRRYWPAWPPLILCTAASKGA